MADAPNTPNPAPVEAPMINDAESDLMSVFGLSDAPSGDEPADPTFVPPGADPVSPPAPAAVEPVPGVEPAAPAPGTPAAAPAVPNGQPPASAAPAPAPAPAAPADPYAGMTPEARLRMSTLEAQLAAATQTITSFQQQAPAAPAPTGAPGQPAVGDPAETPPSYSLQVPQPLLEALSSEDPAVVSNGLTTLVNSLAVNIHSKVRAEYREALNGLRNEMSGAIAAPQVAAEQAAMRDAYYAAFPAHNNPVLTPIISAEAGALAAALPGVSWNADFVAALGARVNAKLQAAGWQVPSSVQPPQQAPVAQPTPAAPAAMLPTQQPRPGSGIPSFETDQQALMDETFRFG